MNAITVYNERCPFCNKQLRRRVVYCPNHINLECLECTSCKSYFYSNKNYNVLKRLSVAKNRELKGNIYKINNIVKTINTKNNNKKKSLKSKYDCIYQINNNCYHSTRIKLCAGNLICPSYTRNSQNQLSVNIISSDGDIYFLLKIFNINYRCFMKVENKYVYKFQNNKYQKMDIYMYLEFENYKEYITFLFYGFKNTVFKTNNKIIIKIKNPNEIKSILNKPYREIKNNISVSKQIVTEYANLYLNITISKQQLFDLISKSVEQNNNKKDKTNNQQNIRKSITVKSSDIVATQPEKTSNTVIKMDVGVTAIVLTYNRKCFKDGHHLIDVSAKLRIAISSGITDFFIPASYCKECDSFFVLKTDYEKIKKIGVILCPIEDCTTLSINNDFAKPYVGTESRIHQLGYNVRKNNGQTTFQRQTVLANIIENTDITKHEIESLINRFIKQHENQPNYSDSVKRWRDDLVFISNYKHGDMPDVLISKIKIGR